MNNDFIMWSPGVTLEAIEKEVILRAYKHYRGNKTATSNALGIAIRTLDNKLEKYAEDEKLETERALNDAKAREQFLARSRGIVPNNIAGDASTKATRTARNDETTTGVRVEPAAPAREKPAVPLQEQPKVQSVLPPQSASGGQRGRR